MHLIKRANVAGQLRCDKARIGERNGRAKLTDSQMVIDGLFRPMWATTPSYGELRSFRHPSAMRNGSAWARCGDGG